MSAKNYQRILQIGVFASLGVVFLVFSNLLFPYISSKQLSFNILIEALLPFWLLLIWKYPAFRPQRSPITWGLLAYLLIILVSSFTGIDFNLSFWGDIERLLGFFHIFHFFILYLYIITVFRNKTDWYWLLSASVLVASVEAIIIARGQDIGTIGNTAYVSGYLIFNLFFAVLLLLGTAWQKQWPYYIAIILMLIAFFRADTSGAIIGLGISLLFLLFLLGIFAARRLWRRSSLIVFVAALLIVGALFSQYNQPWFKNNAFLHDLSSNKATFQTRLISWRGAQADFHLHPWLGNGFGNYAMIFDRQFDPKFFDYSTSDTYFDRAHNNLIDIASTTGIIGLLAYLSIFVAAAFVWRRKIMSEGKIIKSGPDGLRMRELLVLAALLLAYFIQNLAVFDSLVTYIPLMLTLGYLVSLTQKNDDSDDIILAEASDSATAGKELFFLILFSITAIFFIYQYNLRPLIMMKTTINGYADLAYGNYNEGFKEYERALSMGTPLDRDARNTLINLVVSKPTIFASLTGDNMNKYLEYVLSLSETNLQYNENDSLAQMQAAQLYDIASRYYSQEPDIFKLYSDKALEAIEKSSAASPRRIPVYFIKAQIQANRGDLAAAEESFLIAYNLNPNYVEVHCQLANYYFLTESDKYIDYSNNCLERGGKNLMPSTLGGAVNYYQEQEDNAHLLLAYRLLVIQGNEDALLYANLAKLEMGAGNLEEALNYAVMAADIDPSLRPAVQSFMQEIEKLKNEQVQ
ncbi:MAG: O-antigen ligase family protein [Patescibacteria group bacterium]|nr:O-antigen ligase family protein [Patescibacteria group bacterium]